MKIYSVDKKGPEISAESVKSSRKPAEKPQQAGTRYQDRVHLSKDALRLLELGKQARVPGEEGVRAEVVERLQKRIREGTYRFETGKVAEKMLAQALQESEGE